MKELFVVKIFKEEAAQKKKALYNKNITFIHI